MLVAVVLRSSWFFYTPSTYPCNVLDCMYLYSLEFGIFRNASHSISNQLKSRWRELQIASAGAPRELFLEVSCTIEIIFFNGHTTILSIYIRNPLFVMIQFLCTAAHRSYCIGKAHPIQHLRIHSVVKKIIPNRL